MPINFSQILQQSWNFICNQRQFVIFFIACFFLINLFMQWLMPDVQLLMQVLASQSQNEVISSEQFAILSQLVSESGIVWFSLLHTGLTMLIFGWGYKTIFAISQGNQYSLSITLFQALKKLLGFIMAYLLVLFPLCVAVYFVLNSAISGQGSILTLPLFIFGIFLYIRLCLVPLHYLLTNHSILGSIRIIWSKGIQRTSPLVLYCLLIDVILRIISNRIGSSLGDSDFSLIIAFIFLAFLNLIAMIFSYRFYSTFIQEN